MNIHLKINQTISYFIIIIILGLIIINFININNDFKARKDGPKYQPGQAYMEMKTPLNKLHHVGYHTDGSMSSEKNDGDFLMAQHMLAPTVLHPDNMTEKIHVLNFKNEKKALQRIQQLNGKLIYHNQYGKALVLKQ